MTPERVESVAMEDVDSVGPGVAKASGGGAVDDGGGPRGNRVRTPAHRPDIRCCL